MKFTWSILDISAIDGLITHAKYKVELSDQDQIVETEGNWWFANPTLKVPFTYLLGSNSLYVFVNGSKQVNTLNYNETNTSTVTFVNGLNVGDVVEFKQ